MAARMKTPHLSPETRKQLIAVYNEELRAAGLGTFDDLHRLIAETSTRNTINAALLGKLEDILNRMSEPTPQELKTIVSELKGKLRYEIRPIMVQATLEIKKRVPRKRGGGRRKALAPQEESQACDEVSKLTRQKVPYKIALVRVGLRFGVSARTIQRAWQRREAT
jgi:hypothetical protein